MGEKKGDPGPDFQKMNDDWWGELGGGTSPRGQGEPPTEDDFARLDLPPRPPGATPRPQAAPVDEPPLDAATPSWLDDDDFSDLELPPRPPMVNEASTTAGQSVSDDDWTRLVEAVRQKSRPTGALLDPPTHAVRMLADGTLEIGIPKALADIFSRQATKTKLLQEQAKEVFGARTEIKFTITDVKPAGRGLNQPAKGVQSHAATSGDKDSIIDGRVWAPRWVLLNLIKIAPDQWIEECWTLLNNLNLIDPPPTYRQAYHALPSKSEEWAQEMVSEKKLAGHEDEIDYSLLWSQLIQDGSIVAPDLGVYAQMLLMDIESHTAEFISLQVPAQITTLAGDYTIKLFVDEFQDEMNGVMAAHGLVGEIRTGEDWVIALLYHDPQQSLIAFLEEVIEGLFRRHGVLRGPCPRCNRAMWFVPYRDPRAPGRPPLTHTYCPTCVAAIRRESARLKARRHREKQTRDD